MKIGVRVMLKPEVLDIQGRAVAETLVRHGKTVQDCRVGKYIELDLPETDKERAMSRAREMAEFVLHNPLTEFYTLEEVK